MGNEYSNKFPIKKLIILSILTLGIYNYYWFYRNWKYIKEETKKDISPILRTIGLLIPIYNIWLVYDQFRAIIQLANKKKIKTKYFPITLTLTFIFFSYWGALSRIGGSPQEYPIKILLFFPLILLPLICIQKYFNLYWDKTQKLPIRTDFSGGEVILIIVGIILWSIMIFL